MPALAIDTARDIVFDKTRSRCFAGTRLARWLHAADLGFRAVLVAGAHTCMDTPELPTERIIAYHNATLNGPFATLTTTEVCMF